ncbi:MAG: hypothetical protein ACOX2G_07895 [Bacillota bacterium]|jgi:hypothetical protein
MDMDRAVIGFTIRTDENKRVNAEELLRLSCNVPKSLETTLLASIIILLIAALEQGTRTCLLYHAGMHALENKLKVTSTKYYKFINSSIRRRLIAIPELLSDNELRLNNFNKHVRTLHSCISLRNNLVHCTDYVSTSKVSEVTDYTVEWGEQSKIRLAIPTELINSTWENVSRKESESCLAAVNKYFEDIIDPSYDSRLDIAEKLSESELICV